MQGACEDSSEFEVSPELTMLCPKAGPLFAPCPASPRVLQDPHTQGTVSLSPQPATAFAAKQAFRQ